MKSLLLFFSAIVLLTAILLQVSCKKEYSCEGCRKDNQPPIPISKVVANAGVDQTITLPLDSTYLDGSGSSPNGWSTSGTTYTYTKKSGPSQFLLKPATLEQTLELPGYVPTTAVVKNIIPGTYLFRLQVTDASGASAADSVQVTVWDDPLNTNTVTYHDLIWTQGDLYGVGTKNIFLTISARPDLFYDAYTFRAIQVHLRLDSLSSWITVPDQSMRGNNLYTYDLIPLLLWTICYPDNAFLVGSKSSIKIKFL